MEDDVVVEWTFSPSDYFEESDCIKNADYAITIESGNIEARISPEAYDRDPMATRDKLQELLELKFLSNQLYTHKPYHLSKITSAKRLYSCGRQDAIIFVGPATAVATGHSVDVGDSRMVRIREKKDLAELAMISAHLDPMVVFLLRSYDQAVNDPDNELIHLYDIRDALVSKLGKKAAVTATLSIDESDWSWFGKLTNDEPLKQSRHHGRHFNYSRDVTQQEVEKARQFAKKLIVEYMKYVIKRDSGV
jgi:hypothetical protein